MQILPCPTDTKAELPIQQPSIEFFNLRMDEPVMVATDLVVTAVCFYAWYRLRKIPGTHKIKRFILIYFMSMGIATAIGGIIGHGFVHYLNLYYKLPGWFTSMISIAVLERACIEQAKPFIKKSTGTLFSWLNITELVTFMFISFYTLCFFYVEVHSAYGLLIIVFSFSLFVYKKTKHPGNKLFMIAVGFAVIAATVYTMEWYISKWITHIDIGHTFMAIAAYFFYLGSKKILPDLNREDSPYFNPDRAKSESSLLKS